MERRIPGLAGVSTVTPDWAPVARRIRDELTDDWNDAAAVKRFEDKGGRFVRGQGRLDGPGRVVVDGTVFEATRAVVVATGTEPAVPRGPVEPPPRSYAAQAIHDTFRQNGARVGAVWIVILTFCGVFAPFLATSIPKRAAEKGLVQYHLTNIRDFATDAHQSVDDKPFGGGPGMVMMCQTVFDAVEAAEKQDPRTTTRILLSPQGKRFDQAMAQGGKAMLYLKALDAAEPLFEK